MKCEIFAAEIKKSNSRSACGSFSESEISICLNTLSSTYDEVFMLTHRNLALVLVVGLSSSYMMNVINHKTNDVERIRLSGSSDEAISFLLGVARGMRWKELDLKSARQRMSIAAQQSMIFNCFGESLSGLLEFALKMNATQLKIQERSNDHRILREPVFGDFNFSILSNN